MISLLEVLVLSLYSGLLGFAYFNKNIFFNNIVIYIVVLIVALSSTFQYYIFNPVDYNQYKIIYDKYPMYFNSIFNQGHEMGFNALILLFKTIGFSFEFFIFFIVTIAFYGILKISELFESEKLLIFLSILSLVIVFNIMFNLYRQSIAVSIVLIALIYQGSIFKKFILIVFAIMFHISAIVVLPYLFLQNNKSIKVLIIALMLALFFFFIRIDFIMLDILSTLANIEMTSYSSLKRVEGNMLSTNKIQYAYRSYFYLGIALVSLYIIKRKIIAKNMSIIALQMQWNIINYFTYGIFLYSLTYKIGAFSRLGIYFYILTPIIMYFVLNSFFNRRTSKILLLVYSFIGLFGTLMVKNIYLIN